MQHFHLAASIRFRGALKRFWCLKGDPFRSNGVQMMGAEDFSFVPCGSLHEII